MAKLPSTFKTKSVTAEFGNFEPMPVDEYRAKVKKAERVPTEATRSLPSKREQLAGVHYHKLTVAIVEGKYKGRVIFVNLNLEHEEEDTRERAEAELKAICEACGLVSIDDTAELEGIEFTVKLGIKPAKGNYPAANKITDYKSLKGSKKPRIIDEDEDEDDEPPVRAKSKPSSKFDDDEEEDEKPAPVKKRKVSFD